MNREELEGELERRHGASFAWALGCCRRDREEAEDVLQETYLKILDGRARFAGGSSFKTFLFGVIRRTAKEHRRRTWLRLLRLDSIRQSAPTPVPPAGLEARLSRLPVALAMLARRQREVLDLVFAHDMTIEEAAHTLGISVGSARVHYERGKKRLRRELGEERP
jgi:RNA polymerase sigma factor (sigma-70 family)